MRDSEGESKVRDGRRKARGERQEESNLRGRGETFDSRNDTTYFRN
jgi:hypothetical protein